MELNAWHYSTSLIMRPLNHDYIPEFITAKKKKHNKTKFKNKHFFQMQVNLLRFYSEYKLELKL